jgi:regulatory protein
MARRRSAWETALDALARRARSIAEIRRKLLAKGFDVSEVEEVEARLRRLGLVDDRSVAYNHASRRAEEGRRGRRRVRRELLARGLDPAIVEEALDDAFPENDEEMRLRAALDRRTRGRAGALDGSGRERVIRGLVRDGFPVGLVLRVLGDGEGSRSVHIEDEDDGFP